MFCFNLNITKPLFCLITNQLKDYHKAVVLNRGEPLYIPQANNKRFLFTTSSCSSPEGYDCPLQSLAS